MITASGSNGPGTNHQHRQDPNSYATPTPTTPTAFLHPQFHSPPTHSPNSRHPKPPETHPHDRNQNKSLLSPSVAIGQSLYSQPAGPPLERQMFQLAQQQHQASVVGQMQQLAEVEQAQLESVLFQHNHQNYHQHHHHHHQSLAESGHSSSNNLLIDRFFSVAASSARYEQHQAGEHFAGAAADGLQLGPSSPASKSTDSSNYTPTNSLKDYETTQFVAANQQQPRRQQQQQHQHQMQRYAAKEIAPLVNV